MKAIFIDAANRQVREVDYQGYGDIKKYIEGLICVGWRWKNGDVLFVDDEGLLKPTLNFFRISDRTDDQPLAGNGLILGPDDYDGGDCSLDVQVTADEIRPKITWMTRAEVEQWGRDNSSRPAVSITSMQDDSTVDRQVIATYGDIIGSMPKPTDETA